MTSTQSGICICVSTFFLSFFSFVEWRGARGNVNDDNDSAEYEHSAAKWRPHMPKRKKKTHTKQHIDEIYKE